MVQIGAFEAKTRLSELLKRTESGESFVITRHGRPVARLVPEDTDDRARIADAIERLRDFRGMLGKLSWEDIRDDRHEGHRY
jgi:prevent-host-death family protein